MLQIMETKLFFDSIRQSLFEGKLTQSQVDGINAKLKAINDAGLGFGRRAAYIMATAYHETGIVVDGKLVRTMMPVEEMGKGKNRTYGYNLKLDGKRYYDTKNIFYGRGDVQLTWYDNYWKAGQKLGLNLIQNPELVLQPEVSAKILVLGMVEGWFTGKKLSDYFNATTDYIEARRIVNILDKAELIAGYALLFKKAFEAAQ